MREMDVDSIGRCALAVYGARFLNFLNLCADSVLDLSFRMRLVLLWPKSGKTRRRASG